MTETPQILVPYDHREAISLKEAATIARKSPSTIRTWCERFMIGRRIADGHYAVSRIALQMLLDDKIRALDAFLGGDRRSPLVAPYLALLEAPNGAADHAAMSGDAVSTRFRPARLAM